MKDTISLEEARRAILISQRIYNQSSEKLKKLQVLNAVEALSYVQIDSISVVERAHHHTLWNRVSCYEPHMIEQLLQDRTVFEYWSHAAAYLPMKDFRFSLPRKNAIARGDTHWHKNVNPQLMSSVLDRIRLDGPLLAKDFKQTKPTNTGWWDWKPAKIALEQLYMQGQLMVLRREGFQKVYDLTERVLPSGINTEAPSDDDYYLHLIKRYLSANAMGTVEQIGYLIKRAKKPIERLCRQLLEDKQLVLIAIDGQDYYALPTLHQLLTLKPRFKGVKILSPFDNILIQRKRAKRLFGFDYQIECYVPEKNRKLGYFSLPLLWGDTFAGTVDAKIDRKTGVLNIFHLHLQTAKLDKFISDFKPTLDTFMAFNHGVRIQVHKISNSTQTLSSQAKRAITKSLEQQF